ncbi:MAG TPA: N-6 DNA methylase [Candidatus Baltobacteraceae bacterium]|nr:N-6 DNA methylase [Candidatus Baltobacteraceae bacterium]
MKPDDILTALQDLTARERIEFLAPGSVPLSLSSYPPIAKYLLDLKNGSKPETAAEDLFSALCKDLLGFLPTRQVGLTEGYVDFMLPDPTGQPVPLELKLLFQRDGPDALWRGTTNPRNHFAQVKKYLRDHEYVVLTDLRTAWVFGARDFYFENKAFAELPFADFFARCRETRGVLDTLRRVEDTAEKPELEQQFFEDLKIWFNEFDRVKWTPPELATESIILLINKLIFARTIEDFGLVPYRFTQDEYARQTKHWEAKGPHRIVPKFLEDFEDFFDEYYDTEIFSARIWERLNKDPGNLKRFCEKLNFVLGVNVWDQAFTRGIVHYNYRRIDEDIFGKSYEMFLASNRKDEGIYYTPASITGPMADSLVDSLAGQTVDGICAAVGSQTCDFVRAGQLMAQLAEIRVADTACGSGGFLIKVLRAFWRQYRRIDEASAWVSKILKPENGELYLAELPPNVEAALAFRRNQHIDDRRVLIARILLRHVFGVDKDPGAIEVAKTNIWKEAVKLSPADYNYRLLKTDVVRILPNLELNFAAADSLVDVELERQAAWLAEYHQAELKKLSDLRARYIESPTDHAPLDEALALRAKIRTNFIEHFQNENLPCDPAGFALHFWPCWFSADGKPAKTPGFDGIIGNPPWEGFKPIRKEFAANLYRDKPQFSKMGMDGPAFEQWFEAELKDSAEFAALWRKHEEYYERHRAFFGARYIRQGTGDWNLFKLFIEGDLLLVRQGGQFSLLVPSGFQTDEGCAALRRWFTTEHRLDELTSFENRGYTVVENGREKTKHIFPDVDGRFKFGFFKVVKGAPTPENHIVNARFYLHDPTDAFSAPIGYSLEMVSAFSPENLAFMEFRSTKDYDLARKIRGSHPLLKTLGLRFRRELHLTGDAKFLHKIGTKKLGPDLMPLLEGKSIFQYDSKYSPPSWFVEESEVRVELMRKEVFRIGDFVRDAGTNVFEGNPQPKTREELETAIQTVFTRRGFKLHYEFERLAYREVGSSTNERTLIASILPSRACFSHKLMYLTPCRYSLGTNGKLEQVETPLPDALALLTLMNSLTLNFYVRSKVSTGVSIHHLYELPIPEIKAAARKQLVSWANRLLKNPRDVNERAALEVFIARELYGLSLDDWKHLTGTFTFGSGETKAELDEIIRLSLALWIGA